jgi:hypothetical protein
MQAYAGISPDTASSEAKDRILIPLPCNHLAAARSLPFSLEPVAEQWALATGATDDDDDDGKGNGVAAKAGGGQEWTGDDWPSKAAGAALFAEASAAAACGDQVLL